MAQYAVGCGRCLAWWPTETRRPSPSGPGRRGSNPVCWWDCSLVRGCNISLFIYHILREILGSQAASTRLAYKYLK